MNKPDTFSRTQITLHWVIAALVVFQIVAHESIVQVWEARMDGSIPDAATPQPHTMIGLLILALAIWRLVIRLRRGAPPSPENEHPALQMAAKASHILFYILLFALPLSGIGTWFFSIEAADVAHQLGKTVLIALIMLHVAAALAHQFWFKTNVLRRMLGMK